MDPFGYISTINLVGVGDCNNPFYDDPSYLPSSSMIPLLDPPSGNTDLTHPNRSGFGNHAFAVFNGYVFDACAGPSLGKSISQYITDTIDISTTAEQGIAGAASNIRIQTIQNIK